MLDFEFKLALLFGAILIVTGPTVVLPLLRQVRPGGILQHRQWEGIIIDPVGAIIAVLVYEEIISGGFQQLSIGSITWADPDTGRWVEYWLDWGQNDYSISKAILGSRFFA